MINKLVISIIVCALALPVAGQYKLAAFEGSWTGQGKLFEKEASFNMTWSQVLKSKFIQLTFHNEYTDNKGVPRVMDAISYYRFSNDSTLSGYWFDSRGKILPLDATYINAELTVNWGDKKNEQGKTIYRMTSDKTIEVEDFVIKGNELIPFGSAYYMKK